MIRTKSHQIRKEQERLTHWDTEAANPHLDAAEDDHGALGSSASHPVVGEECEHKAEHVLENQKAGEGLNGNLALELSFQSVGNLEKEARGET